MPHPATRRTVVVAALAAPLAIAGESLAQEAKPTAAEIEAIARIGDFLSVIFPLGATIQPGRPAGATPTA